MNVYSFVSRWNRFELRFHVNAAKYIESIKEQDRDIRFGRTQNSAISEHANETGHLPIWKEIKFIDRDPHWYTRT